jgi:hypothetical protein
MKFKKNKLKKVQNTIRIAIDFINNGKPFKVSSKRSKMLTEIKSDTNQPESEENITHSDENKDVSEKTSDSEEIVSENEQQPKEKFVNQLPIEETTVSTIGTTVSEADMDEENKVTTTGRLEDISVTEFITDAENQLAILGKDVVQILKEEKKKSETLKQMTVQPVKSKLVMENSEQIPPGKP